GADEVADQRVLEELQLVDDHLHEALAARDAVDLFLVLPARDADLVAVGEGRLQSRLVEVDADAKLLVELLEPVPDDVAGRADGARAVEALFARVAAPVLGEPVDAALRLASAAPRQNGNVARGVVGD